MSSWKTDEDQLDLGLALRINIRRNRLECHRNRNNTGMTNLLKRWEVFLRLALPVTRSPHEQGRGSSQGVVSPPKYGLERIRIRMYM